MLIIKMSEISLEEPIQKVDLVPVDQNEDNYNIYAIVGFLIVVVGVVGYLIYSYVSNSQKPSEDSQKPTEEFENPIKPIDKSDPPKKAPKLS
jgi:hypothetical protein